MLTNFIVLTTIYLSLLYYIGPSYTPSPILCHYLPRLQQLVKISPFPNLAWSNVKSGLSMRFHQQVVDYKDDIPAAQCLAKSTSPLLYTS